jgi:hypothetical protein
MNPPKVFYSKNCSGSMLSKKGGFAMHLPLARAKIPD